MSSSNYISSLGNRMRDHGHVIMINYLMIILMEFLIVLFCEIFFKIQCPHSKHLQSIGSLIVTFIVAKEPVSLFPSES